MSGLLVDGLCLAAQLRRQAENGRQARDGSTGQALHGDRKSGLTQLVAASRAGLSERTGRRIERLPGLPSQKPPRRYRTRPDPFAEVWLAEVAPLLQSAPHLRATALLEAAFRTVICDRCNVGLPIGERPKVRNGS
jgi:hypothetical protein